MIDIKPVRVHTIIFTKACPLACRYCYFEHENEEIYNNCLEIDISKEEFFKQLDFYDKNDDPNLFTTQILFSGGEPFLYWDWIKEAIEKYQFRFRYQFNTSGYCFTEEMLEFLYYYNAQFVLSVDGGEKLTNYLRPVKNSLYKTGYYKKLKSILPTLLFYFPTTPFRIIVNSRYVDLLYEQYLEAERLGFKYFTFILDFQQRPNKLIANPWTEEDTKILEQQIELILHEIILGYKNNIKKPEVIEVNKIINFLLNQKPFSPDNYECGVFNGRDTRTILSKTKSLTCFGDVDIEEVYQKIQEEYVKCNHKCQKDSECLAFEYCAQMSCPKGAIEYNNKFFQPEELECIQLKVLYYNTLNFLNIMNQEENCILYQRYLQNFISEEE